jgi:hypothetical protein
VVEAQRQQTERREVLRGSSIDVLLGLLLGFFLHVLAMLWVRGQMMT